MKKSFLFFFSFFFELLTKADLQFEIIKEAFYIKKLQLVLFCAKRNCHSLDIRFFVA
jgi:hypothetical protein